MFFYNTGSIKAESCLWMGEEIIQGNTTGSIPQRSLVFSQQHKGVTEIESHKFCRFNFVSIL